MTKPSNNSLDKLLENKTAQENMKLLKQIQRSLDQFDKKIEQVFENIDKVQEEIRELYQQTQLYQPIFTNNLFGNNITYEV